MPVFDADYIQREMQRLAPRLTRRTDLYLIGGGAMSFLGIKDATKDVDAVVGAEASFRDLVEALRAEGYASVSHRAPRGDPREPAAVLENRERFRWDLFVGRVCGGLRFSKAMRARSTRFLLADRLEVRLAAPEDILLLKSVTSRQRDRDDMRVLHAHGVDYSVVVEEARRQAGRGGERAWVAFLFLGLREMARRSGAVVPGLEGEIRALATRNAAETLVTERLRDGPRSVAEVAAFLQESLPWVQGLLEEMARAGTVVMEGERLSLAARDANRGG
jgi:hypothetical protein